MTDFLIKRFVKNSEEINDSSVRNSYGRFGGITGIICNLFLCVLKILVGGLTSSISIAADGFNNLSDMGSSLITIIGFKMAGKPADSDHPFGHGRMEYMSAFIVAMLIILVGVELLKSSVKALVSGETYPEYTSAAIVILVISVCVKFWMFLFNKRISKKINSSAFSATAQDSLNDAIATSVVMLSVIIDMVTELPFNLDAAMGILVALFIIYSGLTTAKDTLDQILGAPPEKSLIDEIENTILAFKEFAGIHDLIIHNYGPGRQFASVHVEVPQNIDIVKCHEQIDLCEKLINEKLNLSLVIHMDPIDTDNETVISTKNQLAESIKTINKNITLHDFRMTPAGEQRTNLIFDVVLPSDFDMPHTELNKKISQIAKQINPTFCCVITFEYNYIGNNNP